MSGLLRPRPAPIAIGARVRLSEFHFAAARTKRSTLDRDSIGTVTAHGMTGSSAVVKWDQLKTPQTLHPSFLAVRRDT